MSLLRPRVRDDRGRPVLLAGLPYHPGPSPFKHLGWRRRWPWLLLMFLLQVLPIGLVLLAFETLPAFQTAMLKEPELGMTLACFCLFVGAFAFYPLHQHVVVRRWGRATFLAADLCPSCRFALIALPPEPDGCTVCPECGAAWRLEEEGTKGRRHEGTEGEA